MHIADLGAPASGGSIAPAQSATTMRAVVVAAPATAADPLYVYLPDISRDPIGPCRWAADKGTTLPAANASALVTWDNTGAPFVIWWDGAPAFSGLVMTSDSRLTNARTPTGSAGGDLAGSYPSPTLATQPYCLLTRTAATSFSTGVGATMAWDTEDADPFGMHAANASTVTIPKAGLWDIDITATLVVGTAPAGAFTYSMNMRVGGSSPTRAPQWLHLGSAIIFSYTLHAGGTMVLAQGDSLDVMLAQNTGATRSIAPATWQLRYCGPS